MTFTGRTKNASSLTGRSKNTGSFTGRSKTLEEDFLLVTDSGDELAISASESLLVSDALGSLSWAGRTKH